MLENFVYTRSIAVVRSRGDLPNTNWFLILEPPIICFGLDRGGTAFETNTTKAGIDHTRRKNERDERTKHNHSTYG